MTNLPLHCPEDARCELQIVSFANKSDQQKTLLWRYHTHHKMGHIYGKTLHIQTRFWKDRKSYPLGLKKKSLCLEANKTFETEMSTPVLGTHNAYFSFCLVVLCGFFWVPSHKYWESTLTQTTYTSISIYHSHHLTPNNACSSNYRFYSLPCGSLWLLRAPYWDGNLIYTFP
jgi:hypothetical protein